MDYAAAIERDASAVFELCGRDLARPIKPCAEWKASDLRQHILDTFEGAFEGYFPAEVEPGQAVARAVELARVQTTAARDVAHECSIHRWDAAVSFDLEHEIEPELAWDMPPAFFTSAWPMLLDYLKRPAGAGETLRLERTDGLGRWVVRLDDRPLVSTEDLPGDVTVRGTPSDLALWVWGRMDPPEVHGDRSVLEGIKNPQCPFLSPGF